MTAVPSGGQTASAADVQSRVAHIDGLRAIAVLAVVAYHASVPGIPGGFTGVDIFFVISGYLIINHIVQELAAGKFSLMQFYARRTLRLFPPLFLMIVVVTTVAAFVFTGPYEWRNVWRSADNASLFVSNFYFLRTQGYFGLLAYLKPLLHTWSLSVEEQFYFAVPLLLAGGFAFAARSRINVYRVLAAAAALVFVASLIGCIVQSQAGGKNAAFFMTYWRAWEFAAGGAIGFLQGSILTRIKPWGANVLGFAGLAIIAGSVMLIGEHDRFPGYLAVFPVLGTVLVIAAGFAAPDALAARLISFKAVTFVGLVSYSWYLWHWPMISLARVAQYGDPSLARDLTMAALSFGLAVVTYYRVELPMRRLRDRTELARTGKRIVAIGVVAAILLSVTVRNIGNRAHKMMLRDPALSTSSETLVAASACPATVCTDVKGKRGILIGDSHAAHLKDTLVYHAQPLGIGISENISYGADPKPIRDANAEFAILSRYWDGNPWKYSSAEKVLKLLLERRIKRILLIGPLPHFPYSVMPCFRRAQRYGESADRCSAPRDKVEALRLAAITELKRLAAKYPEVRYVDPLPLFCDDKMCRPYKDGAILFSDTNHLRITYGADWLYYHLKEDFWWALSGNSPPAAPPAN